MGLENLNKMMLPRDVAEELMRGSYESLVQRVGEIVTEDASKFLGESVDSEAVFPVATFKNYVVVGTTNGDFYRAKYADSSGSIQIESIEQLKVQVVTESNIDEFVDSELGEVIDGFLGGNSSEAFEKLREIANSIPSKPKKMSSVEAAEQWVQAMQNESEWRTYVRARKEMLQSMLDLETSDVKPRFQEIRLGATTESSELPREVVAEAKKIIESVNSIVKIAKDAYSVYKSGAGSADSVAKDPIIERFEAFAEEFVFGISRKLREACKIIENTDCAKGAAMIHDGFAEMFDDIRAASGMIDHFSTRLGEGE